MGMEQAHLNFIEGASLHITGLRSSAGPGIEFLEYLKPGRGKPYPADTRPDDIWYWQTTLITDDAAALFSRLRDAGYLFVSKKIVLLETTDKKHCNAFIVRDDDGHAMMIRDEFR